MNKKYLREITAQYQNALDKKNHAWDLREKPKPDIRSEELKGFISHALELDGLATDVDEYVDRLIPGENFQSVAFYQMLEAFLQSLREDIEQCLTDEQNQLLKEVPITSLNTGLLDARCVKTDTDGNELDFHYLSLFWFYFVFFLSWFCFLL